MTQHLSFEEYKQKVKEIVHEALKDEKWYCGVCCDTIRGSFDSGSSVERAAEIAQMETEYYDGNVF